MRDLGQETILVTGATDSLGRHVAQELAPRESCHVSDWLRVNIFKVCVLCDSSRHQINGLFTGNSRNSTGRDST
jgi:nucleoside-diphosphate-sugar epimerase